MNELSAFENTPRPLLQSEILEPIQAFNDDPGIYTAGAVISHAVQRLDREDAVYRAAELLHESELAPQAARILAESILRPDSPTLTVTDPFFDQTSARARVRAMRSIVRREPLNALRWTDLALAHVNLGEIVKSDRALATALRLAPHNRHVLRSAVRFYVLKDNPDRAHALLIRSPATRRDPWLQAAELAVSELIGSKTRSVKEARATMSTGDFSPLDLSELASELATAEMRAGRIRHAKRYMRTALINPTESTLAQAEWATSQGMGVEGSTVARVPGSFEAGALESFNRGDFHAALREGQAWQADQPFAADAATFTSYVATVGTENWDVGIAAARQGLIASPDEVMLRNNLIFALANSGEIEECLIQLRKLPDSIADTQTRATVLATRGLVAFRQGDPPRGRQLYQQAAELFRSQRRTEREKVALILLAREELLARTEFARDSLVLAERLSRDSMSNELAMWRERLLRLPAPEK